MITRRYGMATTHAARRTTASRRRRDDPTDAPAGEGASIKQDRDII